MCRWLRVCMCCVCGKMIGGITQFICPVGKSLHVKDNFLCE